MVAVYDHFSVDLWWQYMTIFSVDAPLNIGILLVHNNMQSDSETHIVYTK